MPSRPNDERLRAANSTASPDDRARHESATQGDYHDNRVSGEISEDEHDILESEDEREKLLTQKDGISGIFGRTGTGVKIGKRTKNTKPRNQRRGRNEESSALMYEMEEGTGRSSSTLRSRRSFDDEKPKVTPEWAQDKVC